MRIPVWQKSGMPATPQIALPVLEGYLFVSQHEIINCEAQSNYTLIRFTGQPAMLISKSLNYIENKLDATLFFRTHQSYVVNLQHIKKYVKGRGGYVIMSNGEKIEVSARMKKEFLQRMGL